MQHKNELKYKQKAVPQIRLRAVPRYRPVRPTVANLAQELASLPRRLRRAPRTISLFVIANSDRPHLQQGALHRGLGGQAERFADRERRRGRCGGTLPQGETWKLVKVKELADVPEARVRHILLSTQEGKSEDVQKQARGQPAGRGEEATAASSRTW